MGVRLPSPPIRIVPTRAGAGNLPTGLFVAVSFSRRYNACTSYAELKELHACMSESMRFCTIYF